MPRLELADVVNSFRDALGVTRRDWLADAGRRNRWAIIGVADDLWRLREAARESFMRFERVMIRFNGLRREMVE